MAWGDVNNFVNTQVPSGWWGAASTGVGALSDLVGSFQNAGLRSQQQKVYDILSNPGKLANYVGQFNQPMSDQAIASVRRNLGGQWAPMTGGATGGALNQYIANAMAQLETQRQQSASGQAIGALQGSLGAIPSAVPGGGLAAALRALATLGKIAPGQPGAQVPGANGWQGANLSAIPGYADYRAGERMPGWSPGAFSMAPGDPSISLPMVE